MEALKWELHTMDILSPTKTKQKQNLGESIRFFWGEFGYKKNEGF